MFSLPESESVSVISDHGLSPAHLEDLYRLRLMRLSLLKKRRRDVDATMDELLTRGILQSSGGSQTSAELASTLDEMITTLESRMGDKTSVYSDEIDFYLDFYKASGS